MRIVCPSCGAAYEVPEAKLAPGVRRLRCAACGAEWELAPPAPAPAPELAPEAVVPPAAEEPPPAPSVAPLVVPPEERTATKTAAEAPARPRGGAGVVVAWLASLALVAAAVLALLRYEAELTALWPPLARLYVWLGLAKP